MERYFITGLAYIVTGLSVATLAVSIFRVRLSGRVLGATAVAVVGAFAGGMIDNLLLDGLGDFIMVGGVVDVGPALAASVLLEAIFVAFAGFGEL